MLNIHMKEENTLNKVTGWFFKKKTVGIYFINFFVK